MTTPFKAVPVADRIYWVGAIDWSIREFHGYQTSRGTTYNAYLIRGEKTVLVDTVKAGFEDEMLSRISSICDPSEIDIIISNHAEMDHSGGLPKVIERVKPERVLASALGVRALEAHFGPMGVEAVANGASIQVGTEAEPLTLQFIETRFLHWPDSMFTYIPELGFLFSQDAFGMHLASMERFDDQLDRVLLEQEASKYFANILMPFCPMILELIQAVETMGLDLRMVAPDHGPIWRADFPWIVERYQTWASHTLKRKAVVIYDTMWESTDQMARAIAEGLHETGAEVRMLPLSGSHRSDLATEVLDAAAIVVGSPTLNNQAFPTVVESLSYLKGLKPVGRLGAAFGSFGWTGESVKQVEEALTSMGCEVVGATRAKYVPGQTQLQACHDLGVKLGMALQARFEQLAEVEEPVEA